MQIGFLSTKNAYEFLPRMEKLLADKGHELVCSLYVGESADFAEALNYVAGQCRGLIYYGDRNILFDALKSEYVVDATSSAFELNETLYAVMDNYSDEFVRENIIHLLNSRCKIFYTTDVFKTFGKSESELRERLKGLMKNRSRVAFTFSPSPCECEVGVRYSNKMQHAVVDELLANVRVALADCTYAYGDVSIQEEVVRLFKAQGKKVCVAESFTGGGISSAITLCPGASEVLREDIVCYTNEAKIERLGVKRETIEKHGAVSVQTVYEMAVNLLSKSGCDVSVATTGNAGPTSEKENDVGHCFIAIGTKEGVHIFEHNFIGDRKTVTESGIKYALYYLYRKISGKMAVKNKTPETHAKKDNKE